MRLALILEATTEWLGPIKVVLGTGTPYTLNWGTGSPDRPPFLYVPVSLHYIRSVTKHLENATAWYDTIQRVGGIGGAQINYPHYFDVIPKVGRRMKHLGEAHVTVAMGNDCELLGTDTAAVQKLRDLGLFDKYGAGVRVPVQHNGEFLVLQAPYYKDQSDPAGPMLIAERVQIPAMPRIRQRIGAQPLSNNYIPHITIGFIAAKDRINQSFVDRYGTQPRSRP